MTPNRMGWWVFFCAGIALGVVLLETDSLTPLNLVLGSISVLILTEIAQYVIRRKLRKQEKL